MSSAMVFGRSYTYYSFYILEYYSSLPVVEQIYRIYRMKPTYFVKVLLFIFPNVQEHTAMVRLQSTSVFPFVKNNNAFLL